MRTRRAWAVVIPAVLVIVAAGPGTAGAVAPDLAEGVPSPGSTAAVGTCAKPAGVVTDADGDRFYEFRHANGGIERHPIPAADFDPETADASRLQKLGLPKRPVLSSPDRAEWDAVAASVQRRAIPQPSCTRTNARATFYTGNYSGYRAIAASGKTYSGAHSSYTAPSYYLSTCGQESMTQWVGVSNNTVLVQAGLYVTQYTGTVHASAFWEVVGGGWDTGSVQDTPQVTYVPGHRYYFLVEYSTAYLWHFLINDLTNGDLFNFFYGVGAGGTTYIQPYAYFVSERLSYGALQTQYMNHSDVRFRTAMAQINGGSDARLSIQRPEQVIMLSAGIGNQRLGNVDTVSESDSSFTEHWARCGVVE
jgi:hypothetical protein